MKWYSLTSDFLNFFWSPNFNNFSFDNRIKKSVVFLKTICLSFIVVGLAGIPVLILKTTGLIGELGMKPYTTFNYLVQNNSNHLPFFLLSTIVFNPIMEELTFRLMMTRFSLNNILVSFSLIIGSIIRLTIKKFLWVPNNYIAFHLTPYLYVLFFSSIFFLLFWLFKQRLIIIEKFWHKNFGIITYLAIFFFALIHHNNIVFELKYTMLYPILLIQLMVYGLVFTYARVRLGILYAIFLHATFQFFIYGVPYMLLLLKK
jgi:hypothetical protein